MDDGSQQLKTQVAPSVMLLFTVIREGVHNQPKTKCGMLDENRDTGISVILMFLSHVNLPWTFLIF